LSKLPHGDGPEQRARGEAGGVRAVTRRQSDATQPRDDENQQWRAERTKRTLGQGRHLGQREHDRDLVEAQLRHRTIINAVATASGGRPSVDDVS
jgi:hypothetical protein